MELLMNVVFGEPDKMFRLVSEVLAPSPEGKTFLKEFYLTECPDPIGMLQAWAARRDVPPGVIVSHCSRPEDLKVMLTDADVLIIENGKVGTEELCRASSLKLIHTFGLVDNIDHDACRMRGIAVKRLDRHSNRMVAEHVVMLMLALARGLDESRERLRLPSSLQPSRWAYNWPACDTVHGLTGRTVGLLGLGQVGTLVARYLQPFGATVLYTRRSRDRTAEEQLGIFYATLDKLISMSDILSIHVPGNRQTDRMIDAELLSHAKPGLCIVNTARGSIIDEDALVAALKSGTIGGAALDVFTSEPLREDHPLRDLKNVILTPHVAAGSRNETWLDREIGPLVDSVVSALKRS
jgi:D-3-phosphoglycerate dehydrogenase / 2-oxoglutarate reductase